MNILNPPHKAPQITLFPIEEKDEQEEKVFDFRTSVDGLPPSLYKWMHPHRLFNNRQYKPIYEFDFVEEMLERDRKKRKIAAFCTHVLLSLVAAGIVFGVASLAGVVLFEALLLALSAAVLTPLIAFLATSRGCHEVAAHRIN